MTRAEHVGAQDGAVQIDPRALHAIERFWETWARVRGATYRDEKVELMRDGKSRREEAAIKYQKPGRAYLRILRPTAGREVIFDRAKDPRQMTVHPGHFPDITLSIDIHGSLATSDQHHTIEGVGFDEIAEDLRRLVTQMREAPQGERLSYLGEASFDGRKVDHVAWFAGSRPARREKVHAGETLLRFARRVGVQPYAIFVANPDLDSQSKKLTTGRELVVPAYAAQRIECWFEQATGMLLKHAMWNAEGKLYESYAHYEMRLDPALTDLDFDPDNPAYGF